MATPPDFTVGQVLTAAQMNQIGLWKMTPTSVVNGTIGSDGDVTVTTQTTASLNGVFTSDYRNYRIVINLIGTGNQNVSLRLRANGTDNESSDYQYRRYGVVAGAIFVDTPATTTSFTTIIAANPLSDAGFVGDILRPKITAKTQIIGNSLQTQSTDLFPVTFGGQMTVTTPYDGFTIFSGSNYSATISVYGYN